MNTISISMEINGETNTITYSEADVLRFIERAKESDAIQQVADQHRKEIRDIRAEVRDFFSEGEWSDGETTCNRGDVNAMLERIGANKLTTEYRGTFTIHGDFIIQCEDEDEATQMIENDVTVDFYGGDITVDVIEVNDIEENN